MTNKERILDISFRGGLSHLGSCLTALPIIESIYAKKQPNDIFVLSEGHAHLAHLVVKEAEGTLSEGAEILLERFGIHCDRRAGCDVSTGSLGQGLPIAVGMALADKSHNVYCLVSDGELAEGSCWEALRIAEEQKLKNLKIHVNANGWSGLGPTDIDKLKRRLRNFDLDIRIWRTDPIYSFLQGLAGHYHVMSKGDYESTSRKRV